MTQPYQPITITIQVGFDAPAILALRDAGATEAQVSSIIDDSIAQIHRVTEVYLAKLKTIHLIAAARGDEIETG